MFKENRGEGIEWYYLKLFNVIKIKGRGDWVSECDYYLYFCYFFDWECVDICKEKVDFGYCFGLNF